jgi:hypothetical protein
MPHYSEGTRSGTVTKLSNKGIIWKSWEGSLNQGGTKNVTDANGSSQVVANAIDFNVEDPALVKELQAAMASGARVELHYHQWLLSPPSIENDRVVDEVKSLQ